MTIALTGVAVFQLYETATWKDVFSKLPQIGGECTAAVRAWPGDFRLIDAADTSGMAPQIVPTRGTGLRMLTPGEYLAVHCRVDATKYPPQALVRLYLGPVFGESRIFVGSDLRVATSMREEVTLPLSPPDRASPFVLTVIAHDPNGDQPGLASLIPPVLATSDAELSSVARQIGTMYREHGIFRFGIAALLAVFFAGLWHTGLRYRDILWLALAATTLAIGNLTIVANGAKFGGVWRLRVESSANFLIGLAMVEFYLASTLRTGKRPKLVALCSLALSLFAILTLAVPASVFATYRMLNQLPSYLAAFGLLAVTGIGVSSRAGMPEVAWRRNRPFLAIATMTALLSGTQALLEESSGLYTGKAVQLVTLLAAAAVALKDLAVRQGDYFAEKRKNEQLERVNAESLAVSRTVRSLAHDLRRPFALFRAYVKSRTATGALGEDPHLRQVAAAQAEVEGFIDDLLLADDGQLPHIRATRLSYVLAAVVDDACLRHDREDVRLDASVDDLVAVMADPRGLKRALANVIDNAIEATPPGGCVALRVSAAPVNAVQLAIGNTGSYISADLRERIFEYSYTSEKANGTGLGLPIARKIARSFGGDLVCHSDDTGTSFVFQFVSAPTVRSRLAGDEADLPQSFAARSAVPAVAKALRNSNRPLVVVVDDEYLIRLAWESVDTGANVITFADSRTVLAALTTLGSELLHVDYVVLDLNLGADDISGAELAGKIAALVPTATLLLASLEDLSQGALPTGVLAVIDKGPQPLATLASTRKFRTA